MLKTTYFRGRMSINVMDLTQTGKLCKIIIFNICKSLANFDLTVSGGDVGDWNI